MSEYVISGTLGVKLIQNKDRLILRMNGWDWKSYRGAGVCYIDAQNERRIVPVYSYNEEERQVEIAHMPLPELQQNHRMKWKICFFYEEDGAIQYKRFINRGVARKIREIVNDSQAQAFRYGYSIDEFEKKQKVYSVIPYFTVKGRLGLCVKLKARTLLSVVKAKVTSCTIEDSVLKVSMYVRKKGYFPGAIMLKFRTEKANKECVYRLDTQWEQRENGGYRITGTVDLKTLKLRSVYWDVVLCMYDEEERSKNEEERFAYYVNAYNTSRSFRDQFLRLRQEVAYRTEDGFIFFPFVTKKDMVAFKYREVSEADSFWFRLKERIARKLYLVAPEFWNGKQIYLVYEKYCMAAQDNGYYFFRYCMDNRKEAEKNAHFYYVIDKKSPDYEMVKEYGRRVVPFLSIRHMIYLQAAKLLISTDSKAHAYAWRQKGSVLYDCILEKKNVFLQHGVIGLKNITKMYQKNSNAGCDLFIASSEKEKEIIHQKLKYPNKDIVITGLARWDVLQDRPSGRNEILVMPTWRSWLDSVSDEEFCKSSYFNHYEELLTNARLLGLLEREDLYLTFYLHPIVRKYIHDFHVTNERIQLIPFGQKPLNEIIMRSRLMITDYSSASWDMFYLKKPVIFYQFDVEDYTDIHGSYMDFEKDLFGDRANTIEELTACIQKAVHQGYKLDDAYLEKWDKAFAYVDNNNSKRILQKIQKWMVNLEKN
ncbi:MAG: CDP-glycerol glycerophosphotransferase family protein [Lachnospiraceae bacterium]|nr:CDP-glycerol glycerophosphotransferase family protein [Lachnospiraceae bacterium]